MTRCEIRLFGSDCKQKISSFYCNADGYPERVAPILMQALSECNKKREWQPFYRVMAENFDCSPVANTSYIYEVEMGYKICAYRTNFRNSSGGIWTKGKKVGEWTCEKQEY